MGRVDAADAVGEPTRRGVHLGGGHLAVGGAVPFGAKSGNRSARDRPGAGTRVMPRSFLAGLVAPEVFIGFSVHHKGHFFRYLRGGTTALTAEG